MSHPVPHLYINIGSCIGALGRAATIIVDKYMSSSPNISKTFTNSMIAYVLVTLMSAVRARTYLAFVLRLIYKFSDKVGKFGKFDHYPTALSCSTLLQ